MDQGDVINKAVMPVVAAVKLDVRDAEYVTATDASDVVDSYGHCPILVNGPAKKTMKILV